MDILAVILGFVLLIISANILIKHCVNIAKMLHIAPALIGVILVAFGTSLPELIISLFALSSNNSDLAVGNIIGSNIINIALVLGLACFITPITLKKNSAARHYWPILFFSTLLLIILTSDSSISSIDGWLLTISFIFFLVFTYQLGENSKKSTNKTSKQIVQTKDYSLLISSALTLVSLIFLWIGGKMATLGAVEIAKEFNMSEKAIGLTIVALGTSLPELTSCIVAAIKKHTSLAIGTIIGSNLYNSLFILGILSIFKPISINKSDILLDLIVASIFTAMLFIPIFITKKIGRLLSATLISMYTSYIIYLLLFNQ